MTFASGCGEPLVRRSHDDATRHDVSRRCSHYAERKRRRTPVCAVRASRLRALYARAARALTTAAGDAPLFELSVAISRASAKQLLRLIDIRI